MPRVDQAAEFAAQEKRQTAAARGTENILLVEDDKMVRDLAQSVLHDCGYSVLAPERVDEVESLCQKHPHKIHLLVTDVVMPGISGHELARRVTAQRPETKVLYMSGYTDTSIVHRGLLDPDISFLPKPFTPATLAGKVREVLDNGHKGGG